MAAKDDAHIALKACIGYQAEPVRNARGYWVIGYGRRLNDKPGGPKPEAYWSEQFADEELRHRAAAARDAVPEARELAVIGRGGDTEIAHLTLGEIVSPSVLQTPEVMNALLVAAAYAGVPLDRFRLGMPQNSVNPDTGAAEFYTAETPNDKIDTITIYGDGNPHDNFDRTDAIPNFEIPSSPPADLESIPGVFDTLHAPIAAENDWVDLKGRQIFPAIC